MQSLNVECKVKASLVPAIITLLWILFCLGINHYLAILHMFLKFVSLIVGICWLVYYFYFKDYKITINSNYLRHKAESTLQFKSNLTKIHKIETYGILLTIIYTSDGDKLFIFIDSIPFVEYKKIRGLAWC